MAINEYFLEEINLEQQTVSLSPIGFGDKLTLPVTQETCMSCLIIQDDCVKQEQPAIVAYDDVTCTIQF